MPNLMTSWVKSYSVSDADSDGASPIDLTRGTLDDAPATNTGDVLHWVGGSDDLFDGMHQFSDGTGAGATPRSVGGSGGEDDQLVVDPVFVNAGGGRDWTLAPAASAPATAGGDAFHFVEADEQASEYDAATGEMVAVVIVDLLASPPAGGGDEAEIFDMLGGVVPWEPKTVAGLRSDGDLVQSVSETPPEVIDDFAM